MRTASSLSNRIFLACTLLATLSIGFAFSFVNAKATREAENDLRRSLQEAAELADQHRETTLTDTLTRLARLVADLPKLKAATETGDPPTVQPLVLDYRAQMKADLIVVSGRDGQVLGTSGAEGTTVPAVGRPAVGKEYSVFLPHTRGLLQIISVPIQVGVERAEVLGRLTAGFFLDHDRALQFKRVIDSDIAFGVNGQILASSLAPHHHEALRTLLDTRTVTSVVLDGTDYLALARPMQGPPESLVGAATPTPVLIVLRSRLEQLRFLNTLRAGLAGALIVAVLLATIVSYAVARTITRPLAAVTGAMADVAATGDLSRRVPVQSRAWDDEDARLLASAFNSLTESIARFRREESQKERLSSLGRLSTVIAHEIRNPLMIIRASLRTLRREEVPSGEWHEAVADIDGETARLNRIVTEVLDFAKPLRFDLAEASLNDICRASCAATTADEQDVQIALELDPEVPPVVTDAERLRQALVNVLINARAAVQEARVGVHAVSSAGGGHLPASPLSPATGGVTVRTRHENNGRVTITVEDAGIGIAAEDLTHVFDPYFTTRRAGTGLGLPITKNIIEGLGGTITASSRLGHGTEIRIDLPVLAPETDV
jgi:signal transduction histidine kinase